MRSILTKGLACGIILGLGYGLVIYELIESGMMRPMGFHALDARPLSVRLLVWGTIGAFAGAATSLGVWRRVQDHPRSFESHCYKTAWKGLSSPDTVETDRNPTAAEWGRGKCLSYAYGMWLSVWSVTWLAFVLIGRIY